MGRAKSGTDMARLMEDGLKFKRSMNALARDYRSWNRDRETRDLNRIIAQARKIEEDIVRFMGNMGQFEKKERDVFLSDFLHHAFRMTNALFEDVKKIREKFEKASIDPQELRNMEIDWKRLGKTIDRLGNHFKAMESETAVSFF